MTSSILREIYIGGAISNGAFVMLINLDNGVHLKRKSEYKNTPRHPIILSSFKGIIYGFFWPLMFPYMFHSFFNNHSDLNKHFCPGYKFQKLANAYESLLRYRR